MKISKEKIPTFWICAVLIVVFLIFSTKNQKTKPLSPELQAQLDCEMKIYDESTKQALDNMKTFDLTTFTVGDIIRDRRIQEKFCMRLARCQKETGDVEIDNFSLATSFDDCLNESAKQNLIDSGEYERRY